MSQFLRFQSLPDDIVHVVTTRSGGESQGPYSSLNLSLNVGDDTATVMRNRELVLRYIGGDPDRTATMRLAHSGNVAVIRSEQDFGGFRNLSDGKANVDSLVTQMRGVTLIGLVADCALCVLYDPKVKALALVHSGWRGTVLNVVRNTLEVMNLEFGTEASDVIAAVGPVISSRNYEIGDELVLRLRTMLPRDWNDSVIIKTGTRFVFDIPGTLELQLKSLGVRSIEVMDRCTFAESEVFYSYRRDHGKTGRFGVFVYQK